MQQLGDRQVRELVIDRAGDEDDPLVVEGRVDVERTLAVAGLLDQHRNQRADRVLVAAGGRRLHGTAGRSFGSPPRAGSAGKSAEASEVTSIPSR
jgi:hypothetical protein